MWILTQEPKKSARRVAMYVKTLYKWASSEEVNLVDKNSIANFCLPKKSQTEDVVVIRRVSSGKSKTHKDIVKVEKLESKPT